METPRRIDQCELATFERIFAGLKSWHRSNVARADSAKEHLGHRMGVEVWTPSVDAKMAARIFGTPRQSNLPGVLAITGSQA
jgi:hypothetical protein